MVGRLRFDGGVQAVQVKQRKSRGVVTPVTLNDLYRERGEFTAKLIIDPRESGKIDTVDVHVWNSDGRPMDFTAKRWGTKLTVTFKIDEKTSDGVGVIDMLLRGKQWVESRERLSFWIVT